MTSAPTYDDRRRIPRLDGAAITVTLRPRGKLGVIRAEAVDFNRYGTAVHTDVPLTKDQTVFLSLSFGELQLDNLVGVVHNCVRQRGRFRSGILFRLSSPLQHDKGEAQETLARLEAALPVSGEAST